MQTDPSATRRLARRDARIGQTLAVVSIVLALTSMALAIYALVA